MNRTLISATPSLIGQTVRLQGFVHSLRRHGQLVFLDLRDRSGLVQVVGDKSLSGFRPESAVEITGSIRSRDPKYYNNAYSTGQIEVEVSSSRLLAAAGDYPFDIHQPALNVSLPVALDYRAASLRHQQSRDIFKVQSTITNAFRQHLLGQDFTEFHAPTIVAAATEGGSQIFPVDYFGHRAFLAQSPQLYKQVMVPVFERVFTVCHAYRAEPSVTTRHLTEYVSLDVELGFIDSWLDIIDVADRVVKAIFAEVALHHSDILKKFNTTIPCTIDKTPIIKLSEALNIISDRSHRDVRHELDMDPEGEREICRWAKETIGSEMVFITHFPTKKRAWYSHVDPVNPEETLSFDLIGRGVEWISGSQRINDYGELIAKIKAIGASPDDFEFPYVQAFRYGMPPEGGFAIGLERITQNILGLENIRQVSAFPRDMERVDGRLSVIGRPFATGPVLSLHDRLINLLKEKSIDFKPLSHQPTKTSQESAKVRGTTLNQGAKALVLIADDKPLLAVLSAADKLDNSALKKWRKIKDLRLANPEEVKKITSVEIGAVPPFGNLFRVPVVVDQCLLQEPQIAFNAGSATESVIMSSHDFQALVAPEVGSFAVVSA